MARRCPREAHLDGASAGARLDGSAHVADRRFASSESFITLRLFGTRLSREEMRLLAGRAYSAGINRLAFHGVPYPHTRFDGEVWYPFSGGFGRRFLPLRLRTTMMARTKTIATIA